MDASPAVRLLQGVGVSEHEEVKGFIESLSREQRRELVIRLRANRDAGFAARLEETAPSPVIDVASATQREIHDAI